MLGGQTRIENMCDRINRIIRILYWPLLFPEERVATQSARPVDMHCLKTLGALLSCIRQGLRRRMPSQSQPFAPLRALRETFFCLSSGRAGLLVPRNDPVL
jgi:hypothetical protein